MSSKVCLYKIKMKGIMLSASTNRDTFVHSFRYLLSTYHVLGTFLGPEDTMVKKPKFLFLRSLQCSGRDILNKHILLISNKGYERQ